VFGRKKERAEEVRKRLNRQSRDSIRNAKKRISEPAHYAGAQNGFLPLEEALEGRKPAVRKRLRPGWRVISLLFIGLISYALHTAWQSPEYRISSIEVSGIQRISAEEILSLIDLAGKHIFAVETEDISKEIASAFPELKDVRVFVSLPARVEIRITERQPMVAWKTNNGILWIDTEGYLIPARGEASEMLTIQADALPAYMVEIEETNPLIGKQVLDKPVAKPGSSDLAFFSQNKQIEDGLLTAALQLNAWMPNEETLLYQKIRGLGWHDKRGWDVFVGQKLERINDKMVMYETIIRKLENQGISPTLVSVEFLHAPYYRMD